MTRIVPRAGPRGAGIRRSLDRLRLRLTAWYVGTFFAILMLLGIGMFATITRRFDHDLDESLRMASATLASVTRERSAAPAGGTPLDAMRDLRIPDRALYLTDSAGGALARGPFDDWLGRLAREAWLHGEATAVHHAAGDRLLRAQARAFRLANGQGLVAMVSADEIELEDKYAALIASFGAAAFAALVLVAAGGWFLARQSTAPVERTIMHMQRFMADAAHELRTPVTVVRSRAEIALQQSRAPEEYVRALRGIERESERMGRIVEDLLMLARADTGERPIERQRVFLDDVTLDAAEAARAMAERRSVRLDVESFEEAPVRGDANLLRQLVMIVLDNAVKFTDAGGVVRVDVHHGPAGPTLRVTDTGAGIAAEQLPHVFDRFYRGDPSRTRGPDASGSPSPGAGLGLSIARWIADEHGATIHIESKSGQGTTVVVQFPAAAPADGAVSAS